MRASRLPRGFARAVGRRLIVAVALGGYLFAVTGFPLPAQVAKDLSRPYPCQNHACGCTSAEQCWESCCCFSDVEKLAWARENHVEPPTSLLARLKQVAHSHDHKAHVAAVHDAHDQQKCATGSCCSARAKGGCASCAPAESTRCAHGQGCCAKQGSPATGKSSVQFVIGSLARKCRGQVDSWCSVGAVTPPPVIISWQFDWNVIDRLTETSSRILSRDLAPPSPPPRV